MNPDKMNPDKMKPDWSFRLLDVPHLPVSIPTAVPTDADKVSANQSGANIPTGHPSLSSLSLPTYPRVQYPRVHLLSLPHEVRITIWRTIYDDVLLGASGKWYRKPTTEWDGLNLTCHQTLSEIANFWPRAIVPKGKIQQFLSQPYSREIVQNFRHLSLELPFDLPAAIDVELASALAGLSSSLEDLRLFFIGQDRSGKDVNSHGCGSRDSLIGTALNNLMVMNQYHEERQPIFTVLFFLQHLRSLVLENVNYPILQSMILKHKPKLEYLHISSDSRTVLHRDHQLEGEEILKFPPNEHFPPVKVLHIATNVAVTAVQVACKLTATLEELTWIVSDVSRQWRPFKWYRDTADLIEKLRNFAPNLKVLRICIETPIYEAVPEYGELIGSFKEHLSKMTALEVLELHINSKSPWLGEEIVEALPKSLKRLNVADKLFPVRGHGIEKGLTPAKKLAAAVTTRYLQEVVESGQIGEPNLGRKDYIPMRSGRLGFITYEYEEGINKDHCEDSELALVHLNGRLLDRELNAHLAFYDGARLIPPKLAESRTPEAVGARTLMYGQEDYNSEAEWAKERASETKAGVMNDLKLKNDAWARNYFGSETGAQEVFEREAEAKFEDLPLRKWPEEVKVLEEEHWMSMA